MLSRAEQAALNLEEARRLRASGAPYRVIRRQLRVSAGQLSHIRRALKREKAAATRMRSLVPGASDRDLPITRTALPAGLRGSLTAAGYKTLGDLADRLADPDLPGFEMLPGVGPHRAARVTQLLDHFQLLPGSDNLKAEIEQLFPELRTQT